MEQEDLEKLDQIVQRNPPYHRGDHLFRPGHASHALFAVRSGALKSYCITEDGDEQVLGFILPGELTGLDGLAGGRYASASVSLETSSVCELPFNQLNTLCSQIPGMYDQIMRIVVRFRRDRQASARRRYVRPGYRCPCRQSAHPSANVRRRVHDGRPRKSNSSFRAFLR